MLGVTVCPPKLTVGTLAGAASRLKFKVTVSPTLAQPPLASVLGLLVLRLTLPITGACVSMRMLELFVLLVTVVALRPGSCTVRENAIVPWASLLMMVRVAL